MPMCSEPMERSIGIIYAARYEIMTCGHLSVERHEASLRSQLRHKSQSRCRLFPSNGGLRPFSIKSIAPERYDFDRIGDWRYSLVLFSKILLAIRKERKAAST